MARFHRRPSRLILLCSSLLASLALAACGGDEAASGDTAPTPEPEQGEEGGSSSGGSSSGGSTSGKGGGQAAAGKGGGAQAGGAAAGQAGQAGQAGGAAGQGGSSGGGAGQAGSSQAGGGQAGSSQAGGGQAGSSQAGGGQGGSAQGGQAAAGAAGQGGEGGGAGGDGGAAGGCSLPFVDITADIAQSGKYESFTDGEGTVSGSCNNAGKNAAEAVLLYHTDSAAILKLTLKTQPGTASLDGVVYVRTTCDDGATELVCNGKATSQPDPTEVVVPAGDVFIFVDGVSGDTGKFQLAVESTPACAVDSDCVGDPGGPACQVATGKCIACNSSFDCKQASAPRCMVDEATKQPMCGSTDDDGPAGATVLVPDASGSASHPGDITAAAGTPPLPDEDWFAFDTTQAVSKVSFSVDWTQSAPLLAIYDDKGHELGRSSRRKTADTVTIGHLAKGRYLALVRSVNGAALTYTASLTINAGAPCSQDADCLDLVFGHERLRATCDPSGACRFAEGKGQLADGAVCDSDDDCSSGLCSYTPFTTDVATRAFCTTGCASDLDCAFGYVCAPQDGRSLCALPCTVDTECPANLSAAPDNPVYDWNYGVCNVSLGTCK